MTTIKTVVRRDDVNGVVVIRREGEGFDIDRRCLVDRPVTTTPKPKKETK